MNEYKFYYEAAPISEVVKTQVIEAANMMRAITVFYSDKIYNINVFKIEQT